MITWYGQLISIVLMIVIIIATIAIAYLFIVIADEKEDYRVLPLFMEMIALATISTFLITSSMQGCRILFNRDIDVIALNDNLDIVNRFENVKYAEANDDGTLEFDYNGNKVVLSCYRYSWSDKEN